MHGPQQLEKLKILDPACGSGSFLIQAYQFLMDFHRDWYIKDGIEKHSKCKEPKLVQVRSGEWRLSTPERKKILLANIHGVDIDSQAVEVTKLSLLLKVLEGENEQSLAKQMTLWHERALPDLDNNIKCGNSLIESDFYNGVQETMALYKTHKVNPLGGCLPMVIQIPVFFGLYKALMYSIELRHAPFYWWIQDLSAKDPYYITPIIMGATMLIQQKMTPSMGDPMQQKIMMFMPVVFTFLFVNFPSGLVIYWLFQNILSIGQQYYINKSR